MWLGSQAIQRLFKQTELLILRLAHEKKKLAVFNVKSVHGIYSIQEAVKSAATQ